ncbi:F-box protein At3g47030-like isoform X1 [Arabidopsis lyrata subsp. lyrata]|uniref:F-box protein At3g47030-like isoform X1 n=1 Tax=Arabidopsis lyrata subsp. lyrata TaxID=81972 RepID=UPI000A29C51B|nr:F-box protein At3g47030-like isoform X1 [Arabidopsis lyrata subsp. lyrata]|eukprot:XP_020880034.1 F-box protein At3g47030-like isoform X1 [Arabidopsis lyrata subsp. lyrata]
MFGILGFNAAMGKRQKQQLTPRPSNTPREYSKEIPIELVIDVFSILSIEDVARCRCVSKLWSSILRRRDFTQLFLKISSTRPRILLTFLHKDQVCPPILGLICCKSKKPMICNPSTGESKYISLPSAKTKRVKMRPYFGYDPIDQLFKVLCVSSDYVCRVSTLGTKEVMSTWRKVECSISHQPLHSEICMDGILYYLAKCMGSGTPTPYMVVAFDVRLERFKFLPVELNIVGSALINYQGKLAILWQNLGGIYQHIQSFELRVLNDVDEVKWSIIIYELPDYWKNFAVETTYLYILGMTTSGEIVLSTYYVHEPFYIFYYNTVKKYVVRVQIDFGIEPLRALNCSRISTFLNHVENVELMD